MNRAKKFRGYFRLPCLTIRGLVTCVVGVQGFDWRDALIDAAIISGLTFFISLGGDSVASMDHVLALKAAAISAGVQFFIILALKRGIGQVKKITH